MRFPFPWARKRLAMFWQFFLLWGFDGKILNITKFTKLILHLILKREIFCSAPVDYCLTRWLLFPDSSVSSRETTLRAEVYRIAEEDRPRLSHFTHEKSYRTVVHRLQMIIIFIDSFFNFLFMVFNRHLLPLRRWMPHLNPNIDDGKLRLEDINFGLEPDKYFIGREFPFISAIWVRVSPSFGSFLHNLDKCCWGNKVDQLCQFGSPSATPSPEFFAYSSWYEREIYTVSFIQNSFPGLLVQGWKGHLKDCRSEGSYLEWAHPHR